MAAVCNENMVLEISQFTIVVLHSFDETVSVSSNVISNVISIYANLPNLMLRRFKNTMLQNSGKKLHDLSDSFQPIKEIIDTPDIKVLFLCVDITTESINFIKLSYPESEFIKYKITTENQCLQEYPDIFTKKLVPVISYESYIHESTPQLFDDNISCILPNQLYLTGDTGARNLNQITTLGITHIINVSDTLENYFEMIAKPEFKYLKIAIPDSSEITITDYFPLAFDFITDAFSSGCKVMVHCFAGKSRSASIVIGYLMKTQKIKFEDALKFVAKSRSCVEPNIGFCAQLSKYQDTI